MSTIPTAPSRTQCLAHDKREAAELGYGLVQVLVRDGVVVERWGRSGLASTLERSETDGWVLVARDDTLRPCADPLPVGVAADPLDDVVWALVEQDRPQHFTWTAETTAGTSADGFVATTSCSRSRLFQVGERWTLRTRWHDGTVDEDGLRDAWSAGEAQVLADRALHRRHERRTEHHSAHGACA